MSRIVVDGIVLTRLNFGEADKIITIITPDHGKVSLIARGVRKIKSKLAGGIELFSVSTITYIAGKKNISTLASTRLQIHYSHIVEDIDRTMIGYEVLKMIHKATEEVCEPGYYELLLKTFISLNDKHVNPQLVVSWFMAQLLQLLGHRPNTSQTVGGQPLDVGGRYGYDYSEMGFYEYSEGEFSANHIKLVRLLLDHPIHKLYRVNGIETVLPETGQFLGRLVGNYT